MLYDNLKWCIVKNNSPNKYTIPSNNHVTFVKENKTARPKDIRCYIHKTNALIIHILEEIFIEYCFKKSKSLINSLYNMYYKNIDQQEIQE